MSQDNLIKGQFREDFMWGVATASYQIEGGWNADGKSPSVWDTFTHEKRETIDDCKDGDITCDSYHKYALDVNMIKKLKCSHYRFSLSWTRLLPTADSSSPDPAGVMYYNKLIDTLLENNIKPFVTLYHWDLPQSLQDKGGWMTDDIVEKFKEFADFCFQQFGDRVKLWITLNEPRVHAFLGHGVGHHAPGIIDIMTTIYSVSRVMLLAHAAAWHLYDETYRPKQNGMVSISLNSDWGAPKDPNNESDVQAAADYMECTIAWFANPIFGSGDFPPLMKKLVGKKSAEEGLEDSRLPTISDEEQQKIKGTYDFFGLNHYTSCIVEMEAESTKAFKMHPDMEVVALPNAKWERAGSEWLYIVPSGLRCVLKYIAKTYGDPKIIITENGCSTKHMPDDGTDVMQREDDQRCRYIKSYINEALKAVLHDGVDLRGYFLWTLMDNFEWKAGYTERFGLHYVDFDDPERKRIPRKSAAVYRRIIEENGFAKEDSA